MPLSRTRDYLSIGEVLDSLTADFPDISISKIRFLESEGLISPQRTASGYRKFFDKDLERLRHILTLQRDHFLPLRVIKDRLAKGETISDLPTQPSPGSNGKPKIDGSTPGPIPIPGDVHLDRRELMEAADITEAEMTSLEEFGVVRPGRESFDGDDLVTAKCAKALFGFGLEARHLKMYRQFAERELTLFSQLTEPVARKGDADAARAGELTGRLVQLACAMHDAALRSAARSE